MRSRISGQLGLADGLVSGARQGVLDEIRSAVDWRPLEALLSGLRSGDGAAPYPAGLMLRCLLLGAWHGLSDPGLEQALADRLSFRRFAGLSLHDPVPDHTTLWRFRDAMARAGLDERVFEEVVRQLDAKGLVLRQGTLVDATLIQARARPPGKPRPDGPDGKPQPESAGDSAPGNGAAPEDTPESGPGSAPENGPESGPEVAPGTAAAENQAETPEQTPEKAPAASPATPPAGRRAVRASVDPDARWARKGKVSVFGYKLHIGMDQAHGIVRRAVLTHAAVNDTEAADALWCGDEKAVYGDKAYRTKARCAALRAQRIRPRLMYRPNKHHKELSPRQTAFNKALAKIRSAVERPFAVLKEQCGLRRLPAFTLRRNRTHALLAVCAYNLRRAVGALAS